MSPRIELTKGFSTLVSDEDFERLSQYKWHASIESRGTKVYACRKETVNGKRAKIRMHRLVMGLPSGKEDPRVVDHLNHDSLDNRRENLEVTDQGTNMLRSPGWKKKKVCEPWL